MLTSPFEKFTPVHRDFLLLNSLSAKRGVICSVMQACTPVSEENSVASTPVAEEEPKEDGEEFENLTAVLEHLALSEYQSTFEQEKIDVESFVRYLGFSPTFTIESMLNLYNE